MSDWRRRAGDWFDGLYEQGSWWVPFIILTFVFVFLSPGLIAVGFLVPGAWLGILIAVPLTFAIVAALIGLIVWLVR